MGILVNGKSSNNCIQSTRLSARIGGCVRTTPISAIKASAVLDGQIIVPNGLGISFNERLPRGGGTLIIEITETTGEDTLELFTITRAVLVLVAVVDKDAVGVDEGTYGSIGDKGCLVEVGTITRSLVKLGEGTQDNALVVGIGGVAVVPTIGVKAVVDEILRVDHAGALEPVPLVDSGINVFLLDVTANVVGNGGGEVKV